jgi:ferredoxin--NADP+ reductase
VAVIGGATAGAEVAGRLAERGAEVVVIEQNPRPYGKIEDGLPRWHHALRNKEYKTISEKLSRPGVHYLPRTKVGQDVSFPEIVNDWGFSAVVLANGAWCDRSLPVEGADDYIGKGLIYQNPFIIWFNHADEQDYEGPTFVPEDDVIVVGGGLASIDVIKVLMLETTRAKLAERGIAVSMLELEVKGIPKILARHDLVFEDLGLKGSTLFYRRRIEDMPVVDAPEGADEARLEKVRKGRARLLGKAMDKYQFKIEPLSAPDGLIVEGDRLVGIRFRRTKIEGGRVIPTDETFEARGTYVISSIGSIPEPIEGIAMNGELFDFSDWNVGTIEGYPTVFSVGNVVTGKGNIVASRKHAARVSEEAIEHFLGLDTSGSEPDAIITSASAGAAAETADQVAAHLESQPTPDAASIEKTLARVAERQTAVGYGGDYTKWIAEVTPDDLE